MEKLVHQPSNTMVHVYSYLGNSCHIKYPVGANPTCKEHVLLASPMVSQEISEDTANTFLWR